MNTKISVFVAILLTIIVAGVMYRSLYDKNSSQVGYTVYENTEYKYSIEYPKSWDPLGANLPKFHASPNVMFNHKFTPKGLTSLEVNVYPNPRGVSSNEWYKSDAKMQTQGLYPPNPIVVAGEGAVVVNNYPAYKVVWTESLAEDYFISMKDKIYHIRFDSVGDDKLSTVPTEVVNHILSSFVIK
ncbi:MAG: hypothetical protein WAT81_05440 [Candidatus Moraniibacteriota bacterium]